MIDEIVYSELAKSFAEHGQFLVRGAPERGYGLVYPALIAPAWRLYGSIPQVYSAAKAINAVLMSLAAVPAYLIARRVLRARLALVVAVLTVLVPSMLYTGMLMTENAFYPLFLVVALLLVLTLERPTPARQLSLLVLCGIAFETRAQAVALVAAAATAPLLLAAIERQGLRRTLRRFGVLYGAARRSRRRRRARDRGARRVAPVGARRLPGRDVEQLHGRRRPPLPALPPGRARPLSRRRAVRGPARDLARAPQPVAGGARVRGGVARARGLAPRSRWRPSPRRASSPGSRNGTSSTSRRSRWSRCSASPPTASCPGGGASLVAPQPSPACFPFFIPFTRFITTSAVSDTFALLPWWWAQDHLFRSRTCASRRSPSALAAAAVFVVPAAPVRARPPGARRRLLPGDGFVVENGRHGIHKATVNSPVRRDAHAAPGLDRPRRRPRCLGRRPLDGQMPTAVHDLGERVLQPQRRIVYDVEAPHAPDPLARDARHAPRRRRARRPRTAADRAPSTCWPRRQSLARERSRPRSGRRRRSTASTARSSC